MVIQNNVRIKAARNWENLPENEPESLTDNCKQNSHLIKIGIRQEVDLFRPH